MRIIPHLMATRRQSLAVRYFNWRPKTVLLISPVYLAAVAALLLNDFVLKRSWPSVITGKLSDFSGLFALAVFLLVVARTSKALVALALIFAFWKSHLSDGLIQFCDSVTHLEIGRTADLTDLVALLVLPLALLFYKSPQARKPGPTWWYTISGIVSLFAFTATTRGPTPQQLAAYHASVAEFTFAQDSPSYSFSLNERSLYWALESRGFHISLSIAIFPHPGQHTAFLTPRRAQGSSGTPGQPAIRDAEFEVESSGTGVAIRLKRLSINRNDLSVSLSDALRIFESRVVTPVQRGPSVRW